MFKCPTCQERYEVVKSWKGRTEVEKKLPELYNTIPLPEKVCNKCKEK